ncbi:MAG: glycosyltransferase family 9 protein [Deltaproteobacteria bacterium]|nr:glycosyltransferase family 9 protein [Deltaproteobacteria bacterium]
MKAPSLLIVKMGAVGDCVHTLYALRALRLRYPEARIGWVVEEKSLGVVEGHPDLTDIFVFPRRRMQTLWSEGRRAEAWRELRAFRKTLREQQYEVAIDFQNLAKSGFVAWASGASTRIGFRKWREGNFLFMNRRHSSKGTHAIEKYFSLLRPLGIESIPEAVEIAVPDVRKRPIDEFFNSEGLNGAKVVAVNPGASWPNKRLPVATFAAAIDDLARVGIRSILIWGPGEEPLVNEIRFLAGSKPVVAPPTDIKELYYLLTRSDAYVGNDSGPMHIAAAAGIAVVGVFGPSDPGRVGPWSGRKSIVTAGAPCSPCWKRTCPLPRLHCMLDVKAADLAAACRRVLGIA